MERSVAVRVSRWSAAHPRRLDLVVAGVMVVVFGAAGAGLAGWAGSLLSVALLGWLAVRRRYPLVVAGWVGLVAALQLAVLGIPLPADIAVPVVVHTVAAHVGGRVARLAVLVAALGGAVAGGFRWSKPPDYRANAIAAAVVLGTIAGLVWVVGNLVRGRESSVRELAGARRQRERVAAAREIHDVVAHSLAVVIVQADGGRYAAGHAEPWHREQAAEVLGTIGQTARAALGDVHELIEMLRDEPAAGEGGAALERLVGTVRAAGLPVRLEAGRAVLDDLPGPVRNAVLRIVQESLTNVLKHAGPDATADVTLSRTPAAVTVRVSNEGAIKESAVGKGHGIAGMRELVDELGGTLTAVGRPGGFLVEATLPGRGGGARAGRATVGGRGSRC